MINHLHSIYPSLTLSNPDEMSHPEDYQWFETQDSEIIAIAKEDLAEKENKLLSLFLTPVSIDHLWGTKRERSWYHFIKGDTDVPPADPPSSYRFVFFSIADLPMEKEGFHEAFQSLFPERMPIFFESNEEGFIIEEFSSPDQEKISFPEMIDVLMSDFYTKIRFYISEISDDVEEAPSLFRWAESNAEVSAKYRVAAAANFKDTLPYIYIDALPSFHKKQIERTIKKGVGDEPDLLHTIKVFLESGSNATLAAKRLYMHRNSLQYRVDKFIEKTGLDVKQFPEALTTYLALMVMENSSES
ncbi:helix-turn-helix domain-containing protein [Halobacillus litoralis]|uniref:PucR family transcriptional regulator n=1 Tax=Halobacillus litoralis TaxID=45668 RepID=UPI001CD7E0E9|nr:helix-turn-helix domain-containing protein [Halobacillus litoralis]MCA0969689.1 helix-turn-helix domain-containing protein [Halobacillus litoralis]